MEITEANHTMFLAVTWYLGYGHNDQVITCAKPRIKYNNTVCWALYDVTHRYSAALVSRWCFGHKRGSLRSSH